MTSKKDFTKVARIIKEERELSNVIRKDIDPAIAVRTSTRRIAGALAEYFATDNPRFQRERFLNACGIHE